ncbi:hypothetical protein ACJJTC_007451 [Scirpophaga incertulas]
MCAGCVNGDLSVEELTEARLTFVKQQILKKLRLSKKPNVGLPVNSLPMPVAQGQTLNEGTEKPPEFDDYYGRTEQKIIFPVEGGCLTSGRYPFKCMQFELPPDVEPEEVTVVELWFYKNSNFRYISSLAATSAINTSSVTNERRIEFKPCCAPTTFSSLQLLYVDSNNTVTQKTLPNMVVETCGCM